MKAEPSPFHRCRAWLASWLIGIFLVLYALWVAYPMVWVLLSSFKSEAAIRSAPFAWPSPEELTVAAYERAWVEAGFGRYFWQSVGVTSVSVALIVGLGSLAAYALARFTNRWLAPVHWLFLAGMMLPVQLSIVPLFFELRWLGLLNSLPGLILVYTANGLPFAVFVLTGFFRGLPASLAEAARLDGCGEIAVFWRVMLPLARPGLVTVAIFQFIGLWKEYFFAFMLLSGAGDGAGRTLPLGLANLSMVAQYQGDQAPLFAGVTLATLPLLAVYLVLQKQLIQGVTAGALKG